MDILNKIHNDWLPFFEENIDEIKEILKKVDYNNNIVFPKQEDIFRTFFYLGPKDIKIVLLGQDPYINSENNIPQACGLSFSVPKTHKTPPSLKNIFKEIKNCYPDYIIPDNGDISRWVEHEHIFLLNASLTVLEGKSNSHAKLWSNFTDKVIKYISEKNDKTVFLLMGNFAISKSTLVDTKKHKIFTCVHPSPLSANKGFFGSNVFKDINEFLQKNDKLPIYW